MYLESQSKEACVRACVPLTMAHLEDAARSPFAGCFGVRAVHYLGRKFVQTQ